MTPTLEKLLQQSLYMWPAETHLRPKVGKSSLFAANEKKDIFLFAAQFKSMIVRFAAHSLKITKSKNFLLNIDAIILACQIVLFDRWGKERN